MTRSENILQIIGRRGKVPSQDGKQVGSDHLHFFYLTKKTLESDKGKWAAEEKR